MSGLINAAMNRSRTVILILIFLLISGASVYQTIPKEAEPDIDIPTIYVSIHHEGISPKDAERMLVRPMEQELKTIAGVDEIRSNAYQSGASIILEFDAGFDPETALADVRAKVDSAKNELPADADEPRVREINLSLFPILVVTISGPVPERSLIKLARRLKDRIENISSVLKAEIAGDREEQVEIIIDPSAVESFGLANSQVIQAIRASNTLVAAGAMDSGLGRFTIKVPSLFESLPDILSLPISSMGDAVVTLGDVATIRKGFKDAQGFARIGGQPAIAIEVSKRTGSNIIETIDQVRLAVKEEQSGWPPMIEVAYTQDKSLDIKRMLNDLQNSVLLAVVLVVVLIVAILGIRSAFLVSLAIPGSFLTGILVLEVMGLTINIVVLFSLILAVGILIDGAIVVAEYADRKMMEGKDRTTAYREASKKMGWPIIASTLTTLAAFLPLLFWPGTVGEFMRYLPLTLMATLSASLAMALLFIPVIGAWIGKPGLNNKAETAQILESGDLAQLSGFTGWYVTLLRRALERPALVLGGAALCLVAVQIIYGVAGQGVNFFPDVEPERALVQIRAQGNLSAYEADTLTRQVEEHILTMPEMRTVYARTNIGRTQQEEPESLIGVIQLELIDWRRRRPASLILADVAQRVKDIPGIIIDIRKEKAGPPVGKAIQIQISSRAVEKIKTTAKRIHEKLTSMPELINLEDGLDSPGIEWQIDIDRAQAAKFSADNRLIGDSIKLATHGLKFNDYRPEDHDDEVDIVARFPKSFRNLDSLDRIRVETTAGSVPISNFVERVAQPKVSALRRTDGRRSITIQADVVEGVLADNQVAEIKSWLAEQPIPPEVNIKFKGEDEEQNEAKDFLGKAFIVALFLIMIILVTQFNSFYSAFLILSAVIMSTTGVMIGLLLTGQPFGIVMCGIGIIALAGIVVNNNIILIDTFDRLKATSNDFLDAIIRTGAQRLRPVLLTTITSTFGLLPMVTQVNIDFWTREVTVGAPSAQWWTQLATAIVFGLLFSTVLTLVVTPCALKLREHFSWRKIKPPRT